MRMVAAFSGGLKVQADLLELIEIPFGWLTHVG